jgi:D-alanyl-D-alanine carboxypeptidase
MSKSFKIFLITFLVSLPLWWGINVLGENLENFFFSQYEQPSLFLAAEIKPIPLIKESPLPSDPSELNIEVKSAISVKIDPIGEEQVLFEKNAEQELLIASLTKLMTALISSEIYRPEQLLTVSEKAVDQEGDVGRLNAGEKLSVENLLNIILIESSNDAAWVLSEGIGTEAFVDLMNIEAKNLGLENTHFTNPNGLDFSENYSTAADLAKLAYHIVKNQPRIFEISTRLTYEVLNPDSSIHHLALNRNILLEQTSNIVGGKTGWTPQAGGCILLVFKNPQGDYFINVILGTDSPQSRFTEMKKILKIIPNYSEHSDKLVN